MKLHSIETTNALRNHIMDFYFEDKIMNGKLIGVNTYFNSNEEIEHVYKQLDNALEFVKEIMDKRK